MKKQKKIIYFSILLITILIIIITFNIQNITKVFLDFKTSTLNEKSTNIPIKQLNITPTIESINTMLDTDFLIGKYQYNYTGTSSGFYETGNYNFTSGISHLDIMSTYEEGSTPNSSGAYLDGSYNKDGSIYKAYLVVESNNVSNYQDYPITLIYGGENGTPINGIKTKMSKWYNNSSTSNPYRNLLGYLDISDYIKENGYGWYYCCNIPYKNDEADIANDWKIVVIEENPNINIRALKFQLGHLGSKENSWLSTTINLGNVTTKKTGAVTGQFLYNITNIDGTNAGKLQIYNGSTYNNIISENRYRTGSSPLPGIKTRNTIPIKNKVNYTNSLYYNGTNSTPTTTPSPKSVLITGTDVELLDIDGTTNYHNITIENNRNSVILRFNPNPYYLAIHMFGIAYDIDSPEYTTIQTSTVHDDSYVTIEGTTENISSTSSVIGMHNGKITVNIDKELKILSTTAYFTDSKGNKTELDESMYEINNTNNTITYIYGKDNEGKSILGDKLTYSIETIYENLHEKDITKFTVTNEVTGNGKLIYDNNKENYAIDKVIWTTSNTTILKPLTLTIKPNGGSYENNNTDISYKVYTEQTKQINTPTRNGYTFKGWSITEGTNSSINENILTIGTTDTIITANWELDPLTLKSTTNLSLANNKGGIELDWSNYNINNKYFIIYKKQENSDNFETIITLEDKFCNNKYIDVLANDKISPTVPKIDISTYLEDILVTPSSNDNGTTYTYYIEAYDSITNTLLNKSNETNSKL